jgi:hypothetical protein
MPLDLIELLERLDNAGVTLNPQTFADTFANVRCDIEWNMAP